MNLKCILNCQTLDEEDRLKVVDGDADPNQVIGENKEAREKHKIIFD